jgi:hypothetical protein
MTAAVSQFGARQEESVPTTADFLLLLPSFVVVTVGALYDGCELQELKIDLFKITIARP